MTSRTTIIGKSSHTTVTSLLTPRRILLVYIKTKQRTGCARACLGATRAIIRTLSRTPRLHRVVFADACSICNGCNKTKIHRSSPTGPTASGNGVVLRARRILLNTTATRQQIYVFHLKNVCNPKQSLTGVCDHTTNAAHPKSNRRTDG